MVLVLLERMIVRMAVIGVVVPAAFAVEDIVLAVVAAGVVGGGGVVVAVS